MLQRRHMQAPFAGPEIEGWLTCFGRAWAETVEDRRVDALVLPQTKGLARHMPRRLSRLSRVSRPS